MKQTEEQAMVSDEVAVPVGNGGQPGGDGAQYRQLGQLMVDALRRAARTIACEADIQTLVERMGRSSFLRQPDKYE